MSPGCSRTVWDLKGPVEGTDRNSMLSVTLVNKAQQIENLANG